jgi:hypothetical protein
MRVPTVAQVEAALQAQGFTVHREKLRLNIVILRRLPGTIDAFDDMLVVVWTDAAGARQLWACRCTADPGKPSRERPKRRDGTAVMAVCQLVDGFAIGDHRPGTPGAYPCFRPQVPVPVLRYTGLDDKVGDPSTSTSLQIHRASATRESTVVGAWSEACCVVANPKDYDHLLELARAQEATGRQRFTVSLLEVQT